MVSTCPFIFNLLVTVPSVLITIGITVTFMFNSFFSSLARSRYSSLFSLSFSFTLGQPEQQSLLFGRFSFFCWLLLGLVFWPRLSDPFVSQNPWELCVSIFLDRFWVMHIAFVWVVKFKILAQFLMDHLAHPVVSGVILSLHLFSAFAYYVIDRFVFITTLLLSLLLFFTQALVGGLSLEFV